jgi:hypothetical protein
MGRLAGSHSLMSSTRIAGVNATEICRGTLGSGWSGQPLYARYWSAILHLDPDSEIVTIDIKGDLHVLGVQMRASRVMKARDLATR